MSESIHDFVDKFNGLMPPGWGMVVFRAGEGGEHDELWISSAIYPPDDIRIICEMVKNDPMERSRKDYVRLASDRTFLGFTRSYDISAAVLGGMSFHLWDTAKAGTLVPPIIMQDLRVQRINGNRIFFLREGTIWYKALESIVRRRYNV